MSREAFEAWIKRDSTLSIERDGEGYRDMDVYIQWRAWQAAQADAFERAAKVCLDQTRNLKDTKYVRRNAKRNLYLWRCADAIRALAKEPTR